MVPASPNPSLGKLAPLEGRALHATWSGDVLTAVRLRAIGPVGGAPVAHVATPILALGKLPAARGLRSLAIGPTTRKRPPAHDGWHRDRTHSRTRDALTRALPSWPALVALSLDDYGMDFDAHDYADEPGQTAAFFDAISALRSLTLRGRTFLSGTHPSTVVWPAKLERLRVEMRSGHARLLTHLISAELAELTHLDLWLPTLAPPIDDLLDTLLAKLADRGVLRHLGLDLCIDPSLALRVARSSLAPKLNSLSLAGGTVTHEGLDALASRMRLEALDLAECGLDAASIGVARAITPTAITYAPEGDPRVSQAFSQAIQFVVGEPRVQPGWERFDGVARAPSAPAFSSLLLRPRPLAPSAEQDR